jgi:signal transduction histidine kinase
MDNAIKFTSEHGAINISAFEKDKEVHVIIGDTGIGIPEKHLSGLFRKFHQIDSSSTRNYGGNGLGLYISKLIVENHEGNIWMESKEGVGTEVHVRIPLKQNQFSASSSSPSVPIERPVLR